MLLPLLLLACADKPGESTPPDHSDSRPDDTGQPDSRHSGHTGDTDTGHTGDSHSGESGHSGDTHTGETGDPWEPGDGEYIIADLDADRFADEGYEVLTWTLNPESEAWFDSPFDDLDPTFYMIRPADTDLATGPILVWFHGGTLAAEEETEIGGCSEEKVLEHAEKTIENEFLPVVAAIRRGWAILIPRNDWCDYWTGLGDEDPVAPGERWGYVNVERMLDFVLAGDAGYPASGERYAWGTSAGGGAAIHVTNRYGGFSGIVSDSAPSSMFLYYETSPEAPRDVFGGAPFDDAGEPTEAYDRFAAASAETIISDLGYRVPIAVTWNTLDTLNSPGQPRSLVSALEETYTPEGVNWFEHDLDHPSPAPYYHTQSKWPQVPWGYTGQALFDFFDGHQLLWVEAEDGCTGDLASVCELGELVEATSEADHAAAFSAAAYLEARGADGKGILWADLVPGEVPIDTEVTATLVVEMQGLDGLEEDKVVGTLAWEEGDSELTVNVTAGDFAPESAATTDDFLTQYAATRIKFTPSELGAGVVRWKVWGYGRTNVDAVIYSW